MAGRSAPGAESIEEIEVREYYATVWPSVTCTSVFTNAAVDFGH